MLTTKPTFDDAFYSILGLLIGTLLFVYIFRFISGRISKSKLSFKIILRPLLYASFLFAPILVLKDVIGALILGRLFSVMRSFMGGKYDFAFLIVCSGVIYFVMLFWWLYIVYLGLKLNLGDAQFHSPRKLITLTCLSYILILIPIANIDNIQKIATIYQLNKHKNEVELALAQQPPDYFSAAGATLFISSVKELTPYRRYCEKIRSVVYFSKLVTGFDSDTELIKINNGRFEDVEDYYIRSVAQVSAMPHSIDEYRHITTIKNVLTEAKKEKDDIKFVHGEYISNLSVFEIPFFSTLPSIRIIP